MKNSSIDTTPKELQKGMYLHTGKRFQLIIQPGTIICTQIRGFLFEEDKTFFLPSAIPNLREFLKLVNDAPRGDILIIGHADQIGKNEYNRKLSEERAASVKAFLQDDFATWMKYYETPPVGDQWATREDQIMLSGLTNGRNQYYSGLIDGKAGAITEEALRYFQIENNLKETGMADSKTRMLLIKQYMDENNTSIRQNRTILIHGCGEEHPLVDTLNVKGTAQNRCVEILLFQGKVDPFPRTCTVPGGCKEYEEWQKNIKKTIILNEDEIDEIESFSVNILNTHKVKKEDYVVTSNDQRKEAEITFFHFSE